MLVAPEMRVDLSTAPSVLTLLAAHTPVMQVPPVYKTVSSIWLASFHEILRLRDPVCSRRSTAHAQGRFSMDFE